MLALLNRAVFWFHPLAWWLERRMAALAEEACDAVVLAHGHDPRDYSRYLIDMAAPWQRVAPESRFGVWHARWFPGATHRRILEGGPLPRLSRVRLVCACIACAATSAAFATSTLDHQRPADNPARKWCPLRIRKCQTRPCGISCWHRYSSRQLPGCRRRLRSRRTGVKVSGADRILHREPVEYPAEARAKGIEGTVILDVHAGAGRHGIGRAVIGGPMDLRRAALSSVLQWHFSKEAAPRQQVSVEFSLSGRRRLRRRSVG